jgi:hypothetical protein
MNRPVAALAVLALSAAAAAAPGAKGKPGPVYFATQVGDTWVYQLRGPAGTSEMTEAVTAADPKDGAVVVTVSRTYQGETIEYMRVAVTDLGLRRLSVGGRDLPADRWLVKAPVKAGDTWTVELDNPPPGRPPVKMTFTVRGEEEVEVPAGKFKAVRVDAALDEARASAPVSSWYAPGVGLVKSVSKVGKDDRVQVLKSFAAGKK